MSNHERSQASRELHVVVPGLVVELMDARATVEVDGARVEAVLGWHDGRVVIDRLTVERGSAASVDTTLLRSISLPALVTEASAGVKAWADDLGTEPIDESRLNDESLEAWAARLALLAYATNQSATEYVAKVQGIKSSSANQRLVVARKMGLLDVIPGAKDATKTKERKGKS